MIDEEGLDEQDYQEGEYYEEGCAGDQYQEEEGHGDEEEEREGGEEGEGGREGKRERDLPLERISIHTYEDGQGIVAVSGRHAYAEAWLAGHCSIHQKLEGALQVTY